MHFKRNHWLLRLHRYLGLLFCALFLMWFLSGIVMMYVRYPVLTADERRAHLPLLDVEKVKCLPPAGDVTLTMLLDRPVYKCGSEVVYADDGTALPAIDSPRALSIAGTFFGNRYGIKSVARISSQDQWLNKGSFVAYLPAYKIEMKDPAATTLYVSCVTGEVFQDVTLKEKILSWMGPIPHWLYLKILIVRPHRYIWTQVVIWTSLIGCVMCLSGIAAGIIRFRRRRITPYKKRWLRWHHYTGLVFGLFTFTWVFSGLFSMDPLKMSVDASPPAMHPLIDITAMQHLKGLPVKEVRCTKVKDYIYMIAYTNSSTPVVIDPDAGIVNNVCLSALDSAVQLLVNAPVATCEKLDHYDAYYHDRADRKPLPVIRYQFTDQENTAIYVDPHTGEVLLRLDNNS
ncbi:MAG TPA: PepSY domain-containing protein, partial [Chitinophaga sp.]|uniref:PepSY domain-containing protein n=1 Tax=Chitinophaga sp. TaxID=1869181 RepID=UPI002C7FBA13